MLGWKLRITKFLAKDVNFETIIDTLWWHKTRQHSGYNHTHVKQNLLRKQKRAYKSSWSRRGNQKSFTLTIPLNLENPEDLSRNHCTSTHHVQKLMGLLTERYQVWMKNGGRIPSSGFAILKKKKISCLKGRHFKRRFGEPFNGPTIPFGSMVQHHPISAKDLSRLHQFGKRVSPGRFFGCVLCAGVLWKGDILVADVEELGKMDASEIHARNSMRRKCESPKMVKLHSRSQMKQSNYLEEIRI